MRQSVVRAGPQTRGQALVLGRSVFGRRRGQTESLAQRWQILMTVSLVQRDAHAFDQAPQPLEVHLLSHPTMMSQVTLQIPDAAALGAVHEFSFDAGTALQKVRRRRLEALCQWCLVSGVLSDTP
jgi:hypothetical protein